MFLQFCKQIFKDISKDEEGSILPMIAVVLILTISLGCVNYALVVMYRDRATVRNALDAGVTSSLAATAEERKKPIYYGEYNECTDGYWETRTRKDGSTSKKWICTERTYYNNEGRYKNYIYLRCDGESIAKNYFLKNIELNNLNATIVSFQYNVKYDDQRIYEIEKNRYIDRPEGGFPYIINKVTNQREWWTQEFRGVDTRNWQAPGDWTKDRYETREVIFPRWVEVKASVTVELPIPFGSFIGKYTYKVNFDFVGIKELVNVID